MHEAHPMFSERPRRERQSDIGPLDPQTAPGVGWVEPREDLDKCRLPATVLTEEAVDLTLSDLERSSIESLLASEGLAQVPEPKRRRRLG
jgi:hypothetical protein